MIEYEPPKFTLNSGNPKDLTFQAKPSTPANKEATQEVLTSSLEELEDGEEANPGEQELKTLKAFSEPVSGSWDDLVKEELDSREIRHMFQEAFL